ncbi:hypothetical protein [Chryseobacterium tongliaoense]|uniref:hypothetical protein n=1 Tax=Chryseobacterium tongliaoense TaxID=3240933 RepID=UPI003517AF39
MKNLFLCLLLVCGFACSATETQIIIRAKARDAKFIGSSLGGAYVIIRNKINNKILAEGKTSGSTGNTDLIMKVPKTRESSIVDDGTAQFLAKIDITEPTFVNVEVLSPFNNKQAQAIVSTELWLIPGKHILGDGIIMEIPGFIIDILKPRTHQYMALKSLKDKKLPIEANVVMMCGCVVEKGGVWNPDKFEIKAILKRNGTYLSETSLSFVSTNLFETSVPIAEGGNYELIVYAYDSKTGNTGVDKINYVIYE